MLVNLKEILEIAEKEKIAIGSFNTPNLTSLQAVISAAEELNQPVIIMHAQIHEEMGLCKMDDIAPIMVMFAKKAKVKYATATAGECGKALKVLGYANEAAEKLTAFVEAINNSGAKKFVVSSPFVYDALVNDAKELGLKVKPAVMHVSEFVVSLKIKFAKKAGELYYLESDYLKNYNDNLKFPRELLKQLKAVSPAGFTTDILDEAIDFTFGTNNEESYTCGEGAVVLNVIRPDLVKKMAKYVEARAVDVKNDVIVVASPYSKLQLSKNTKLKVSTLTELAASCL